MKIQMIGCSHHHSSVAVRERLAFSPGQVGQALDGLRARFPHIEAVLLSTCNRVEIYTAAEDADFGPSHEEVAQFMADFHQLPMYEIFNDLFERTGEDAVRHLFTVAASLDSMVVGEPQILSQVKAAYELAKDRQSIGPLTHAVFQTAARVAKRVTTETSLHQRRVSIPSVAVGDFANQIFERFDDKNVLVIGAGENGRRDIALLARRRGARRDRDQSPPRARRATSRAVACARRTVGKTASVAGASRPGHQHHRGRRADHHAAPVQAGRTGEVSTSAVHAGPGHTAQYRSGRRRPAGRVSVFDR